MKRIKRPETFAEKMHVIPRTFRPVQARIVDAMRGYFSHAPGWVLLTTIGRKTALPREVLLPCTRSNGDIIVISTYGWRSNWIRNLRKNAKVKVTCDGAVVSGRAEIVDDLERKCAIVSEHPFVPPAPFKLVHALAVGLMRPVLAAGLRRWVTDRPVVVIHT